MFEVKTVLRIKFLPKHWDNSNNWSVEGFGETVDLAIDDMFKRSNKYHLIDLIIEDVYLELTDIIETPSGIFYSNVYKNLDIKLDIKHFGLSDYDYDNTKNFYHNLNKIEDYCSQKFYNHPRKIQLNLIFDRLERFSQYVENKKKLEDKRKQLEQLKKELGDVN